MRNRELIVSTFFLFLVVFLYSFSSKIIDLSILKKRIIYDFNTVEKAEKGILSRFSFIDGLAFAKNAVDIQSVFTPDRTSRGQSTMVLFQAGTYDTGLTLKLNRSTDQSFDLAVIIAKSKLPGNLNTYNLTVQNGMILPGKNYKLYLRIPPAGKLSYRLVALNGAEEKLLASDEIDNSFYQYNYFSAKNVSIGSDNAGGHSFNGTIKYFEVLSQTFIHTFSSGQLYFLEIIFLLIALVCALAGNKGNLKNIPLSEVPVYIFYSMLVFAYPVMQLYAVNMANIGFVVVIKIIVMLAFVAAFLFLLFVAVYKNLEKAFLFTLVCAFYVLFMGRVYDYFSYLIKPNQFVFLALLCLLTFYVLLQKINISVHLASIVKKFTLLLFLLSVSSIGFYGLKSVSLNKMESNDHPNLYGMKGEKPDIYFILSDMHASQSSVIKHLGYNNEGFVGKLRAMGFYVPNNASSNYPYTVLSVPSMLNLSYMPNSIKDVEHVKNYYSKNQLAVFLKSIGYKYVFISPRRYIIDKSDIADVNMTCSRISDFEGTLWNYSFLFRNNSFGNTYRQDVLCGYDELRQSVSIAGPKFVFLHMLSPHPPYVFNEDGGEIALEDQLDLKKSSTLIELNKKGYLGQLQYNERQLLDLVGYIRKNAKKPPIIIIQGDHGFPLYTDSDLSSGKIQPPADNVNARMRVLGAYYFPNGGNAVLYDTITPINMTRGLLRYYFKRNDLTRISDISYWSPEIDVFNVSAVTEVIRSQDAKRT